MREAPVKTTAFQQGILVTSKTKKERLGILRILEDGRKFRYAKAGAVALDAGKTTVAAAFVAAHISGVIASSNQGGTQITVTVTAGTAIGNDDLANGYLQVNDGTGEGRQYRIESNTAKLSAGTSVTLSLADPITGYDGTTKVTLAQNPWSGVVVSATPEAMPTGIATTAVPANYYFWCQTGGPAIAWSSGTAAVGTMMTHGATDGSVAAVNTTFDIDQPVIGIAWGTVGVSTEYKPIFLTID